MQTPAQLLFDNQIDRDGSLFKSRIELSTLLLKTPGSSYFAENDDIESYTRKLNSLQSYVSHIISGTGIRKITSEFCFSISLIIKKRLNNSNIEALVIDSILKSIEHYNSLKNSVTHKNVQNRVIQTFKDMIECQRNANYVAIFTNRPIELEADPDKYSLQFRQTTIEAILDYSTKINKTKYRFNFPSSNIAILFWRKLSYLLVKELQIDNREKIESIDKFLEKRNKKYSRSKSNNEELNLKLKINDFLKEVNSEAWIQVFYLNEPVFVVPQIVFNPNELNRSDGFIFITSDSENLLIHKYQPYDLSNWREKVWDLIKLNRKSTQIKFQDAEEENIDDLKINLK